MNPTLKSVALSATLTLAALASAQTGRAQNLFEADYGSNRIYEFTPGGTQTTFATGLEYPYALAFSPASVPEANTLFDVLGGLALGGTGLL